MDASPLSCCQFMKESFPFGLYESMGTEAPAVFLQSLQHWCIKINSGTSGTTSGSEAKGETNETCIALIFSQTGEAFWVVCPLRSRSKELVLLIIPALQTVSGRQHELLAPHDLTFQCELPLLLTFCLLLLSFYLVMCLGNSGKTAHCLLISSSCCFYLQLHLKALCV